MKNKKLKQIALTTALLTVNSFVFAADNNKNMSSDGSMRQQTMSPSLGDKMPPYVNPVRFTMDASFIYWQADVENLDAGLEGNFALNTTAGNIGLSNKLSDKDLDFDWQPGFKLGAGLIYGERDQYDLTGIWTWLRPEADLKTKSATPISGPITDANGKLLTANLANGLLQGFTTQTVIPGFAGPLIYSGGPATNAKSNWRMNYNTFDLEFGRRFDLGKNLTLRPHMGLRGAWINQHLKNFYDSKFGTISFGQPITLNGVSVSSIAGGAGNKMNGELSYHAAGLRAGSDVYWNFTNHFAVFGKVSGSILYGYEKLEQEYVPTITANFSPAILGIGSLSVPSLTELKDKHHRTKTTLQGILGLQWHTDFNDDRAHVFINVAYEVNQWFQMNTFRTITGTVLNQQSLSRNGNLGLHGLTVDLAFDF